MKKNLFLPNTIGNSYTLVTDKYKGTRWNNTIYLVFTLMKPGHGYTVYQVGTNSKIPTLFNAKGLARLTSYLSKEWQQYILL